MVPAARSQVGEVLAVLARLEPAALLITPQLPAVLLEQVGGFSPAELSVPERAALELLPEGCPRAAAA